MEKKKPPHTEYEKQLLIQLVQPHVSVLDCRKTDGVTTKKKQEAWEKLTISFNNSPNITQPVTSKQLKKMWQNLKSKAREAKTIANQVNKTGGGPQPPEIGALEGQVLAVMPNVMPTIDVDIDCDIMYMEDHEKEADDDSSAWRAKKNRVTEIEFYPPQSTSSHGYPAPTTSSLEANPPQSSTSTETTNPNIPLHPSTSSANINPPQPSTTTKKRKFRHEEDSIDSIKKKIYLRELDHMEEKFQFDRKLQLEKHNKEMEILEIKKQKALKELNE